MNDTKRLVYECIGLVILAAAWVAVTPIVAVYEAKEWIRKRRGER